MHVGIDRRAPLRLSERYGDWDRRPFDAASSAQVSVYRRCSATALYIP